MRSSMRSWKATLYRPSRSPLADHRLRLLVGHRGSQVGGPERLRARRATPRRAHSCTYPRYAAPTALDSSPQDGKANSSSTQSSSAEQHVGLDVHEDPAAQRQPPAAVAPVHEPAPPQQHVLEEPLGAAGDPVEAQADQWPAAAAGSARPARASGSARAGPPRDRRLARAPPPRAPPTPPARTAPCPSPCTRARRTSSPSRASRTSRRRPADPARSALASWRSRRPRPVDAVAHSPSPELSLVRTSASRRRSHPQ